MNTPIFLTIKPTLGHAQCCKILIKRAIKQKQKQKNTSLILAWWGNLLYWGEYPFSNVYSFLLLQVLIEKGGGIKVNQKWINNSSSSKKRFKNNYFSGNPCLPVSQLCCFVSPLFILIRFRQQKSFFLPPSLLK